MRRLYFVSGRVDNMTVWAGHFWANGAADARDIGRKLYAKDKDILGDSLQQPDGASVTFTAKPSKSNPANAMNFY